MNREAGKLHTLRREGTRHFKGPGAMKRGLFYLHRRRLRAALALPAVALLLYSCDPPALPPASREVSRVETKKNEPTITTTPTDEGGELVVTKGPEDKEISRVETKKDGSTITTTPTAEGGTLVVHKNPGGNETQRVETRSDKSAITTTPTPEGGITKELVIHSSVTAIEDKAFENNELTSLTVGNSIRRIGKEAFAGNPKLKTVRITGTGAVESNLFTYEDTPRSRKGIFNESVSSGIELIIEEGITEIGTGAFYRNKLTSVSIPPSVTKIGNSAFSGSQLTSLTIGNGVKTIGEWAFARNKLTSLTIPPSVTVIGNYAFRNNQLTSLTIGNGVKTIGNNAFLNNKLASVTIPPSVTSIGGGAFRNNQLTSVILPKALYDARRSQFDDNPADLRFRNHKGDSLGGN